MAGSQCSSAVEQRFRKPSVAGSIPAIGSKYASVLVNSNGRSTYVTNGFFVPHSQGEKKTSSPGRAVRRSNGTAPFRVFLFSVRGHSCDIRSMRVRAQLLILLSFLAAVAATAGDKEPTYEGRSLSEWLHELDPHLMYEVHHPPPEIVAIRQIGTNALPLLLKWMAAKDPPEAPKPHLAACFNMTRSERAAMAISI